MSAEKNNDSKKPNTQTESSRSATGGSGGRPTTGATGSTPGTTSSGTTSQDTKDQVKEQAKAKADEARQKAGEVAENAKQQASEVADQAKQKASETADQVRQGAESEIDHRTTEAGERVGAVADSLRSTGDDLREQDADFFGNYADMAADQMDQFSYYLKDHSAGDFFDDIRRAAERQPEFVVAAALGVGFLVGRFLKSSSESQYQQRNRYNSRRYGSGRYDSDQYGSRPYEFDEYDPRRYGSPQYGSGRAESFGVPRAGRYNPQREDRYRRHITRPRTTRQMVEDYYEEDVHDRSRSPYKEENPQRGTNDYSTDPTEYETRADLEPNNMGGEPKTGDK